MSTWEICFPNQVFLWPELNRQVGRIRYPGAVGTSELRPFLRRGHRHTANKRSPNNECDARFLLHVFVPEMSEAQIRQSSNQTNQEGLFLWEFNRFWDRQGPDSDRPELKEA